MMITYHKNEGGFATIEALICYVVPDGDKLAMECQDKDGKFFWFHLNRLSEVRDDKHPSPMKAVK